MAINSHIMIKRYRPALGRPFGHFSCHPDAPLPSFLPHCGFPRPTPGRAQCTFPPGPGSALCNTSTASVTKGPGLSYVASRDQPSAPGDRRRDCRGAEGADGPASIAKGPWGRVRASTSVRRARHSACSAFRSLISRSGEIGLRPATQLKDLGITASQSSR